MARHVPCGSILKNLMLLAACVLAGVFLRAPLAWAQHGGHVGHVGGGHSGGSAHFGGGPLGGAPVSAPPVAHASAPLFRPVPRLPLGEVGTRYFRFTESRPIYIFPHSGFHHPRHFNFGWAWGWGWGFNSLWWQNCNPSWAPGFSCSGFPQYGYGFGNYPTLPYYISPLYMYAGDERELVQLYFNDGSATSVTDYWVADGQIHFTTVEESGPKPVEHMMNFSDLDLQKTIDVNTQRGFRFVLRNEPWQQYLKDHPDTVPPAATPPASSPPEKK
jgi:hypothetical protein